MSQYAIVAHRGYQLPESYQPIVFSQWLRSLRFGNDFFKLIDSDDYFEAYHRYIEQVLDHPDAMVRFATLADNLDVVLGFSVCRDNILDYVYVGKDYRLIGIARSLVPAGVDTITHLTRTGLTIWGNKNKPWKFNPFA